MMKLWDSEAKKWRYLEDVPEKLAELPSGKNPTWQISAIRIIVGITSIAASVVSAYLVITRLESFIPNALAIILGVTLVLFAIIAFETIIVFLQRKKIWIASLFAVIWITIWSFTLISCVSGFWQFYEDVRMKDRSSNSMLEAQSTKLSIIRQNESDKQLQVKQKSQEISDIQNIISSISNTDSHYQEMQSRLLSRESQLSKLQDDLTLLRNQEVSLIDSAPKVSSIVKKIDFYEWLGNLTKINPDTIELITALMPAILVDIMSSTGIALALFLI